MEGPALTRPTRADANSLEASRPTNLIGTTATDQGSSGSAAPDAATDLDTAAIPETATALHPKPRPRRRDAGRRASAPRKQELVPPAAEGSTTPGADTHPTGRVSVYSTPWGNVRIDGQVLGPTPLEGHELSAGAHLVEVIAPDTNRVVKRRQVVIPAGGSVKVEVRNE
jgi:hypothetical protein